MFNVGDKIRITNREHDERWWAEVIDGGLLVSLNNTLSSVPLCLHPDEDMEKVRKHYPEYPGPESNGKYKRIIWGHVLRCSVDQDGRYVAEEIVGFRLPDKN